MDASDRALLKAYADRGHEPSFGELVNRHIALVYSTALRNVGGDVHHAQDVAQMVFMHLAHNAKSLLNQRALAGWLYRDTVFSSSKMVRAEQRRLERQKQAAIPAPLASTHNPEHELLPVLDEIISTLPPRDRDVLVLRFFDGLEFRTAAARLGISEGAFQKRVERTIQKLRTALASKGVTAGSAAMASALMSAGLVASAPSNLAAAIVASSVSSAAAMEASTLLTLLSTLPMTKLKIAGAALLVAFVTTPLLIQQRALTELRAENRELRSRGQERSGPDAGTARLGESVDQAEIEKLRSERNELLRLRGEVGMSRRQAEELKAQLEQARRAQAQVRVVQPQEGGGPYHAADAWANVGYEQPQSAAITFFWALRNGDQAGYSGAFGRDVPLEDAWSDAFKSIKGSFLSKPTLQPNGDMQVSVAHETVGGDLVSTLITYRQENSQWLIRSMAGFPTGILDASSATASYGRPLRQSTAR